MIECLTYREGGGRLIHLPGSNFWRGKHGITVEHMYQARKTTNFTEKADILTADSPNLAKKLGRKVKLRADWDHVKVWEMTDCLTWKAITEPEFVRWLLDTGDEEIQEGNWWHDNFWGVCICESCLGKEIDGLNALGRLLMELREAIRRA